MYNNIGKRIMFFANLNYRKGSARMVDMCHAYLSYGYIAEVYLKKGRYYGLIANNDPPHRTFSFHENERGAYAQGDYQMPIIIPLSNRFSGPTMRLKNPEVGDAVAYYPGISERGPYARIWCLLSPKKTIFPAAERLAATKT